MLAALSPVERQDLIMSVGVHVKKRRATPMRLAQLIEKAKTTDSLDDIADHVNLRGPTILHKLLSLNKLPENVRNLVDWGVNEIGISFSVAAEIARVASEADKRELAKMSIEHRLSKSEVQAIIQRSALKGSSIADAAGEILQLRSQVERHFLYVGLLDGGTSDDAARRSIRRNLAELVGAENVLAVRCSNGRFSIVLSDAGANSEQVRGKLNSEELQSFINTIAVD